VSVRRAVPIVVTEDPAGTRAFYEGFLGFSAAMDDDGFLMLASPDVPTTQVIVTWASPTAFDPEVLRLRMSVEVADVNVAHADALARGLDIVYGPADEPWGVRRFFVREPSGAIVNVVSHLADLPPAP
jgi:catechol 2,3-dioxygenase-like lactoylglutathione lyase family enzyme